MAKKKAPSKKRGRPFKKKNAGGPGRSPMTDEEKALAKLTRGTLKSTLRKYLQMTRGELKKAADDANTPALDLMVISVMNAAIMKGDEKRINWFLEQLFGKMKESVDITSNGEALEAPRVIMLPRNGREKPEEKAIEVDSKVIE